MNNDESTVKTIKKNGFIVIENFFDNSTVSKLKHDIDEIINKYPAAVEHLSTDRRIFGSEYFKNINENIYNNKFFNDVLKRLYKSSDLSGTILSQKLYGSEVNDGSAGHWHRDAHSNQFKVFIYLNDIDNDGGPFQFYKNTNTLSFRVNLLLKLGYQGYRYLHFDKEFDPKKNLNLNKELVTVSCKQGTILIADTSMLDRGKPNSKKDRYSMTYYAYKKNQFPVHIKNIVKKNFSIFEQLVN